MPKSRLSYYYKHTLSETLIGTHNLRGVMQLPQWGAIICSASSLGASQTVLVKGALEGITGQRPRTRLAKKSLAAFNLRKGSVVGCQVTIRRQRLYLLLDQLLTAIMPKMNDGDPSDMVRTLLAAHGDLCFGWAHILDFPPLEPFFTHFENVGGLHINCIRKAGASALRSQRNFGAGDRRP